MKAAKSCESMDDLLQSLNNIKILDSPMIFDFHTPEIYGIEDPLDQFIKINKFPSPTSCICPLCNIDMPPYKMETDDVWSSHLLNEHEFLFGNMDVCYQFLQYGLPSFNFAWFPMDQSKGIIHTVEFNNKNRINGCCPIFNCKFHNNNPELLENHLIKKHQDKVKLLNIDLPPRSGNTLKLILLINLMSITLTFST
jgi:hypothetical protein